MPDEDTGNRAETSTQGYQQWVKEQQGRLDFYRDNMRPGHERKEFVSIGNRGEYIYFDENGVAVGIFDVKRLDKPTGGIGGTWQLSMFVDPGARGKGISGKFLDEAPGIISSKIKTNDGVSDGLFTVANVIMPPEGTPDHDKLTKAFAARGYEKSREPDGEVYLRGYRIKDPTLPVNEVRNVGVAQFFKP